MIKKKNKIKILINNKINKKKKYFPPYLEFHQNIQIRKKIIKMRIKVNKIKWKKIKTKKQKIELIVL